MTPADVLLPCPVKAIDEVIAVMAGLDECLSDADGVKWFNRLYLRVTQSVREAVGRLDFDDTVFLSQLDVSFANLYFAALAAATADPRQAPRAWRPLFRNRHRPGIARLQFALAGMNAHINRDLPQGIVDAFTVCGGDLLTDETRHRDFQRVNPLLESVEADVKGEFSVGLIGAVDVLAGRVDDVVAMWNVCAAREAAWTNAQVLWSLRRVPVLRDRFFARLDGLTGLAGQGLLLA
jgi:hypothetical protein